MGVLCTLNKKGKSLARKKPKTMEELIQEQYANKSPAEVRAAYQGESQEEIRASRAVGNAREAGDSKTMETEDAKAHFAGKRKGILLTILAGKQQGKGKS